MYTFFEKLYTLSDDIKCYDRELKKGDMIYPISFSTINGLKYQCVKVDIENRDLILFDLSNNERESNKHSLREIESDEYIVISDIIYERLFVENDIKKPKHINPSSLFFKIRNECTASNTILKITENNLTVIDNGISCGMKRCNSKLNNQKFDDGNSVCVTYPLSDTNKQRIYSTIALLNKYTMEEYKM